jgi:ribosomal protein L37AE/L43A
LGKERIMRFLYVPKNYVDRDIEPEQEKHCPKCGSSDVFESKNKTKWIWYGVCRKCFYKGILDTFYK